MRRSKPVKKQKGITIMSEPVWTLIADFVAGSYERDGNPASLADVFAADSNWGGYLPSHVQSGVGLVNSSGSASKPVLVNPSAYLVRGFAAQFLFDFVEDLPSPAAFQVNALDLVNWSQEYDITSRSVGSVQAPSSVATPNGVAEITGLAPGEHIIDVRFAADRIGLSVDGGPRVDVLDGNTRAWDNIAFSVTRGVLKSMKIIPL